MESDIIFETTENVIIMKQLQHEHPLVLIDLQPKYPHYEEEYDKDDEDEDEDEDEDDEEEDDLIMKWDFRCPCNRCGQEINFYHRYYYKCTDSCDYYLHKFCAELSTTLKHRSHRALNHTLTLLQRKVTWRCNICKSPHKPKEVRYRCSQCDFDVDINCAVAREENRIIYHPSHPHPLAPTTSKPTLCECDACGNKHMGIFYHCTTCFCLSIPSNCAFLPKKLLIQHTHPLTLSYSFPKATQIAKFFPRCRICGDEFKDENLWIYECEKCRYYAHLDCATSRGEPFMSIFLSAGLGKTVKNFEDADHPNLLHLPFPDETHNILQRLFSKEMGSGSFEMSEGNLKHMSHQHPLSLVHTQGNDITRPSSSSTNSLSCHNPMKKIELLCNGCLRPITTTPFYKCANEDQLCNFVLHEWCTRLPCEVQNHPGHPEHTLILLPEPPGKFFGVFSCDVCRLRCNGFAYGCVECEYYVDVNCGFIPEKTTHEGHPNHLLLRVRSSSGKSCVACGGDISKNEFSFNCPTCDFDLHIKCALLLPRTIRHKFDKHPMNLSYLPIENHKSEYFCEICEEEFDPKYWFYHCYECKQSVHCACSPLILQCEAAWPWEGGVYRFVNIKFGGILNIEVHPHPLSFALRTKRYATCIMCGYFLRSDGLIFKCLQCKFVIHHQCCERLIN